MEEVAITLIELSEHPNYSLELQEEVNKRVLSSPLNRALQDYRDSKE